ncbi:hypothetical protein COLO4_10165 [Corchorus olitorius]|uniref:Uncharacterized protein n=1 Tax=Corchorus olitorius TaxID=93759 RepID=A0A1R3K9Y8_9ROSI|nr:hypothetical protein COLO4_10165 [Corchorus olitorius]
MATEQTVNGDIGATHGDNHSVLPFSPGKSI